MMFFPHSSVLSVLMTVLGVVAGAVMLYLGRRYARSLKLREEMEKQMLVFIMSVSDSLRNGVTLSRALVHVGSTGDFGPFTEYVRRLARRIEVIGRAGDAIDMMMEELRSSTFNRIAVVLKSIDMSGGDPSAITGMLIDYLQSSRAILERRKAELSNQVVVVFMSFGIMIAILSILMVSFFPRMEQLISSASGLANGIITVSPSAIYTTQLFFLIISVAYAVVDGVMAGLFVSGRYMYGLEYAGILTVATFIVFFILSGGVV